MKDKVLFLWLGYLLVSRMTESFFSALSCKFKRLEFDGIGGDFQSIRLLLGLNVQNENTTDIPYDGFDGELTYLGKSLTAIKSVKSALVRGHSTTEVQFTFSISLDNIKTVFGSNWGQFVSNFKNFTVYSNFHLKGELFFTVVDRKITYRLDQPLSKPS